MSTWFDAHLILVQATLVSLLLATSIQLPLRMGVFSFAGVGSYAIGAYTAAIMVTKYEWSTFAALALGVLIAAVVGYLLALVVVRLDGLYLAMATIAFDLILTVAVTNGGDFTGGPTGLYGAITDLDTTQVFIIVVVVLAFLAMSERGRIGRRIDAVREDPELAVSVGIPVLQLRRMAFVVSGALGAVAGGINTLLRTTVAPNSIGFSLVVLALTMIIVGGSRSWAGALIGALVFTWLPSVLQSMGDWQTVVYGVIVALAAIFVPKGLLGVVQDSYRAVQRRRRHALRPAEDAADRAEDDNEQLLRQLSDEATAGGVR